MISVLETSQSYQADADLQQKRLFLNRGYNNEPLSKVAFSSNFNRAGWRKINHVNYLLLWEEVSNKSTATATLYLPLIHYASNDCYWYQYRWSIYSRYTTRRLAVIGTNIGDLFTAECTHHVVCGPRIRPHGLTVTIFVALPLCPMVPCDRSDVSCGILWLVGCVLWYPMIGRMCPVVSCDWLLLGSI
jgi:hypothetical protein